MLGGDTVSVTVVSCVYGNAYDHFIAEWAESVATLSPRPDEVIVASDRDRLIPHARVVVSDCPWQHPQAWHLREAIEYASSDWIWQLDIDDRAMPDALDGLDDVAAAVWQMGFLRSDGEVYCPPDITGDEFLASERNVFTAGSAFRTTWFWRAGGFADVALQDWLLWRRMAKAGAWFRSSGRTHYYYQRHEGTRGATELGMEHRAEHLAEMLLAETEGVVAYA